MRGPQDCKELSSMDGQLLQLEHIWSSLWVVWCLTSIPHYTSEGLLLPYISVESSWETSSPYCGYSQMEEEEMADGFADYLQVPSEAQLVSHFTCASCLLIASCKPPGINPVMCLTQRSQKLFPPCLDLEARPEINPDQCLMHSYSL